MTKGARCGPVTRVTTFDGYNGRGCDVVVVVVVVGVVGVARVSCVVLFGGCIMKVCMLSRLAR